ncbi:diphosphomevalonate decarboxylase [Eupransor demetentiae]|uniref:diphosphomevalonate decarboxylase n=1 Tax=Eupransor demetentiae TaxID=3109584 RepID=A0ABM9N4J1_9LACO|nr:Mevalonate pyrophosphate decarboxylase (MVD1) [Lactobacillaceae bacterium LMG 33000]
MTKATATAHTNIALIKYWGKKNVELNLPTTSSLSLTLDKFYTTTTVSPADYGEDQFILNQNQTDGQRVHRFLDFLRSELGDFDPVKVDSLNAVPTSAGLASSASAFAALTGAVAKYLDKDLPLEELSRLARRGSGSATRSFFPGFALWQAGDSDATSYAYALDTPQIPIALIVAEVSGLHKKVSSSDGMQRAMTSPDYPNWVKESGQQIEAMQKALQASDLEQVGALAEANALAMHALNLSARDRRFTYYTQQTLDIIKFVQDLRHKGFLAYVTLDAGPNVKIITSQDQAVDISSQLQEAFPSVKLATALPGPGIAYE